MKKSTHNSQTISLPHCIEGTGIALWSRWTKKIIKSHNAFLDSPLRSLTEIVDEDIFGKVTEFDELCP